jgi:hypothetical protein
MVRAVTFVSLLSALVVGVYLFGAGSTVNGPTSRSATSAEQKGAAAAATANFQQAAAALEQNRAFAGTYLGTNLGGFGVTLVRADESAYCVQAGAGPSLMHLAGPGGTPAAGGC